MTNYFTEDAMEQVIMKYFKTMVDLGHLDEAVNIIKESKDCKLIKNAIASGRLPESERENLFSILEVNENPIRLAEFYIDEGRAVDALRIRQKRFDELETEFNELKKKWPDHPLGMAFASDIDEKAELAEDLGYFEDAISLLLLKGHRGRAFNCYLKAGRPKELGEKIFKSHIKRSLSKAVEIHRYRSDGYCYPDCPGLNEILADTADGIAMDAKKIGFDEYHDRYINFRNKFRKKANNNTLEKKIGLLCSKYLSIGNEYPHLESHRRWYHDKGKNDLIFLRFYVA